MKHGQSQGAGSDTAIQITDARVQGRKVQRLAFAQMAGVVAEVPGFASETVMNFKIPRIIHRHGLLGVEYAGLKLSTSLCT
jgi:hypothetical protein